MVRREREACVLRYLKDRLHETLAEGCFADDQGAIVVLECARDDLSSGSGVAIYQHDDWILRIRTVRGTINLIGEGAPALRDGDLALLQEFVGHVYGFVEKAARI